MKKVFLYLYPIEEYIQFFMFYDDSKYDEWNIKRPLPIINECIQKRYRDKGYDVVFALYPDKKIYGIDIKNGDKIIYTDVLFEEASGVDENKNIKKNFIPKYPNEKYLLNQLGDVDKLIVGGFHALDCVKKVAEEAFNQGIDSLVDLDLTDLFFSLYRKESYFNIDEYNPNKYEKLLYEEAEEFEKDYIDNLIKDTYSSPAYGLNKNDIKIK